jgi:hypothetical protein
MAGSFAIDGGGRFFCLWLNRFSGGDGARSSELGMEASNGRKTTFVIGGPVDGSVGSLRRSALGTKPSRDMATTYVYWGSFCGNAVDGVCFLVTDSIGFLDPFSAFFENRRLKLAVLDESEAT